MVRDRARAAAEERLLDALAGPVSYASSEEDRAAHARRREGLRGRLRAGELDAERVRVSVEDGNVGSMEVFSAMGVEQMGVDMETFLNRVAPPRLVERSLAVARARDILESKEAEALLDKEVILREAVRRVEESGIVFIDELDKVVGASTATGPDVSRGGVQRDLLPLVEGCTVQTRHGPVRTDHILFIAAGAFSQSRPEDLIPELQGRFPLRVDLTPLDAEDFARILKEPEHALTKQYKALLGTDGVDLDFTDDGIEEIAALAQRLNTDKADIGARRLHMVLERLLEPVSFGAPEEGGKVLVDAPFVLKRASAISRA